MLILTIRTDNPTAEIGLYDDARQLTYHSWQAHRQLAETLHISVRDMLKSQNKSLDDIGGIACFQGPGSFTGLRIGLTVANALSYALQVPITTQMNQSADDWKVLAIQKLLAGESDAVALPEYGAAANITLPKQATKIDGLRPPSV